jgi:hypothetical protein
MIMDYPTHELRQPSSDPGESGRQFDDLSAWCKEVGLNAMAIPTGDDFPVYYHADSAEIEYSELSNPDLSLREVGSVLTRKRTKVSVPPPLQYFRPLP